MPKLSSLSPYLLDICATKKCLSFAQRGQKLCRQCQLIHFVEKVSGLRLPPGLRTIFALF